LELPGNVYVCCNDKLLSRPHLAGTNARLIRRGKDIRLETTEKVPDESSRWLCRLFGHKYDPVAEYYGHACCGRCGYDSINFEPSIIESWAWAIKRFYWETRNNIGRWITCPECKWHFGKHDPKNEHLPF